MSSTSTGRKAPNAIDVHIGRRIRARRGHLGMSQKNLASALGLSFQQVQKYEKGVNRVGGSRLQQISDALGIEPSHFLPVRQPPRRKRRRRTRASFRNSKSPHSLQLVTAPRSSAVISRSNKNRSAKR
jgi:transcriptional regulator with XRE-family HTH domain